MTQYIQDLFKQVETELDERYLFGSRPLIRLTLMTFLARGHILIEGPPGTGKTLTAKLFAHKLSKSFKRIQFTSDLLPSDIIGSFIYNPGESKFSFIRGPLFSDVVLADEINRTPPRTQSALLEAMEERHVSAEGTQFPLSSEFFVVATQNPFEMEGTFPLPEAQLDRFLVKVAVSHADGMEEVKMMRAMLNGQLPPRFDHVLPVSIDFNRIDDELSRVTCDESVLKYIADILARTRNHAMLHQGSSVRGGFGLAKLGRVRAASEGRTFVTPDDIKRLAVNVLQHRVRLSSEAQLANVTPEQVILEVLSTVPFPT